MTVAAMIVITLFVTASAAPERPSTFVAPPFLHLLAAPSRRRGTSLEEPEPAAAVREVVHVVRERLSTKPFTSSTSLGMNVAADRHDHDEQRRGRRPRSPARARRRPRRSIQPTNGSSASARKSAITTQASTCRAIQTTSSATATARTMRRTRRIVRGTKLDHALRRHLPSIVALSDVVACRS